MVDHNHHHTSARRYCPPSIATRRHISKRVFLIPGVVNALLDRLTDDNMEVKHDALGSIDALILKTGESLCKELYRKNILTLLDIILHQVLFASAMLIKIPLNQLPVTETEAKKDQWKFIYSLLEVYYLVLSHIWYYSMR